MCRIRISLWNSLEKVILHMLKISTKFGVAPRSFCENQNSVQNQDQDQDHDITSDFNTRPTFHTWKTPTKFCLEPLLLQKLLCPHEKSTYVHTSRQTDRQTEIFFGLCCLLRHKNHKYLSKGENFLFFHSCDYNTFSFYILRMWWESKKYLIFWCVDAFFPRRRLIVEVTIPLTNGCLNRLRWPMPSGR